ncbi:hypothetical protein E6Q11_00830 [Candidatus Dojkabacteria bacterium]|uniref:NadR/Ttd14 AAA domain-containing protein n=1 Tax=Candidatus Dojkabacteria bacterium TaxID=2099670 RepID=A0A5C7JC01_9BACT|nr:MAG: hypothetical protein E6Q11_00830 [Candidatus Dojkabacteria bacterium]
MKSIIVMTALIPTTGHRDLVKWAVSIPGNNVTVLLNSLSREPISGSLRELALIEEFGNYSNVKIVHSKNNDAPQSPEDHEDFWNWWKNEIEVNCGKEWDFVIASESYGKPLADVLGAKFLPYDINRELNQARGTEVRGDIFERWEEILPAVQRKLHYSVGFFGQESVGKTTLSKMTAERFNSEWVFEYARPYMESGHPVVTDDVMRNVFFGQSALQRKVKDLAKYPLACFDTDLFSTVGYYPIYTKNAVPSDLIRSALNLKMDVYYLLPDDIPLEPDPLRFGDGKRESTKNYWRILLEKYGLKYVEVPSGTTEEKLNFIQHDIRGRLDERYASIRDFIRD